MNRSSGYDFVTSQRTRTFIAHAEDETIRRKIILYFIFIVFIFVVDLLHADFIRSFEPVRYRNGFSFSLLGGRLTVIIIVRFDNFATCGIIRTRRRPCERSVEKYFANVCGKKTEIENTYSSVVGQTLTHGT